MNYKRILISVSMIVFMGVVVVGATGAFFSDTETSEGNTFTAGSIDLTVGNDSYLVRNGEVNLNEDTTWDPKDLEDGDLFFDFADIKPGDLGEDTITLNVNDNDSWMCADLEVTENADNDQTEPEALVDQNGTTTGELAQQVEFFLWADDGDNVYEDNEDPLILADGEDNKVTFERFLNGGVTYPIADSQVSQLVDGGGPLAGGQDYHIGKAWCLGDLDTDNPLPDDEDTNPVDRGEAGLTCNGVNVGNETQTDSLSGNVTFTAVQSRNNDGFVCQEGDGDDEIGCAEQADIMLVLDSSGSMSGDMDELKTAAKGFVDSVSPSVGGANVGVVDFDGSASLVQSLTDDATSTKSAIDGLNAGGSTDLSDGIDVAQEELDDNDRDDSVAPDFIIIVTDGAPDSESASESSATASKDKGTTIFAVGVDISTSNADFLTNDVVSQPGNQHYFNANDIDDVESQFDSILSCPSDIEV